MEVLAFLLVVGGILFMIYLFVIAKEDAEKTNSSVQLRLTAVHEEEKKRREAAKLAREQAMEKRRQETEAARRKEQRELGEQIFRLSEWSITLFESMTTDLSSAEEFLDQAETNFADGAFAPFWDSVERAAVKLGAYDKGVTSIKNKFSKYTELVKKVENPSGEFPLGQESVKKLGVGTATAERMQGIVRKAQCDFQFAAIFEQRRTNQILIAGFTSLAQALDLMTSKIAASINDLLSSVDVMTSTLGEIAGTTDQLRTELSREASERAAREHAALEKLDNIQRGRKPAL